MQILLRIAKMAWRYRLRLVLAYLSFFAAVGFALLVPRLFGTSVDRLVRFDPADGRVMPLQVDTSALVLMALALLGASIMRGVADLARTYITDSLSQKVSYDLRNLLYDKLQHLSFAFHDSEHTGNLMSKATADIEQIRRFVNLGLVRSLDVVIRLDCRHQHLMVFRLATGPAQSRLRAVLGPAVDPGDAKIARYVAACAGNHGRVGDHPAGEPGWYPCSQSLRC